MRAMLPVTKSRMGLQEVFMKCPWASKRLLDYCIETT